MGFFGSTLSRGKKNDYVFHEACLTYLCSFYDTQRKKEGKDVTPVNIVWTDQCPSQYKCRQNFWNVATSAEQTPHSICIHKFGAKYRFKGSWDAFSKVIKEQILNNELIFDCCTNAWDCYGKLGKLLSKDGSEEETKQLLEYERQGDVRALRNSTCKTCKTFIGYATEDKQEYDILLQKILPHIVFTDPENIPDMSPIKNTLKIFLNRI